MPRWGSQFLQSVSLLLRASMSPLNSFREAGGPAKPCATADGAAGGAGAASTSASAAPGKLPWKSHLYGHSVELILGEKHGKRTGSKSRTIVQDNSS